MLSNNQEDEKIIGEYLASGNEDFFKMLLSRHIKHVYNFVRQMTGNGNEAEDISQEVFLKVWKNLKKYKTGQNFKTWLFAIAKNSTIDFLRKSGSVFGGKKTLNFSDLEKEDDDYSFSETIESEELLPDEALQKLQNSEFLKKMLDRLPLQDKTILLLHYQEEMTFEEIGQILKKSPNTVKSQHRRAILELRKMVL